MSLALSIVSKVIAAEQVEDSSKLREFFEHFTNVFPKKQLWDAGSFKAGVKHGLSMIKPFLTGETKIAQILPMQYQLNPILTVKKFGEDEIDEAAEKLVKDVYGPHLKVCVDVVYGVRGSLKYYSDSHGAKAVVEFEDSGKLLKAELVVSTWSENSDKSELAIYVNISKVKKA
jgi:hypothetical protein